MKKTFAVIIAGTLFLSMLWALAPMVRAEGPVQVYIGSDGSVAPSFAPVSSRDNVTYTFTGNISYPTFNGIVVERNNIVIDGNGYTVQGNQSGSGLSLTNMSNVTIKNINIKGFVFGIYLSSSDNNTISGNTATANALARPLPPTAYPHVSAAGIFLDSSSYDTISGNNAKANTGDGIELWSSSNNTVSGNNATANGDGIVVGMSSNNNTVSENTITANGLDGIDLMFSSYNTVVGNNVTGNAYNGIYLDESSNNTVRGNDAASNKGDGVELWGSSGNILRRNSMVGNAYAFGVSGEGPSDFVNDVDVSNTVDGKSVYYWVGEHNKKVPVDAGCVILLNCSGMTIQNMNLTGNENGILLAYTTNSTVTRNNVTDSDWGILLAGSSDNTVSRNAATGNNDGIMVSSSDNNTVSGNIATGNSYSGITLIGSSHNIVLGNTATANGAEGIDLVYSSYNTVAETMQRQTANMESCSPVLRTTPSSGTPHQRTTGICLEQEPMPSTSSWNIIIANTIEKNNIARARF